MTTDQDFIRAEMEKLDEGLDLPEGMIDEAVAEIERDLESGTLDASKRVLIGQHCDRVQDVEPREQFCWRMDFVIERIRTGGKKPYDAAPAMSPPESD